MNGMVKFSHRSGSSRVINPLWNAFLDRKKRGEKVLNLTESNPTRSRIPYPARLLNGFSQPSGLIYDPDPKGNIRGRRAVGEYYREKGIHVSPERIFLTASTSEAYHFLFRLFFDPGDSILIPRPGYPLLDSLCRQNDINIEFYPVFYDGLQWKTDLLSMENRIHSRTRAILLVHPNNPTGSYFDTAEQEQISLLAARKRLPLIVDEVFFDFLRPSGGSPKSFAGNRKALTFTLSGLSKAAGLPQVKISWIVASGPLSSLKESLARLEVIADTSLSVNTPASIHIKELLGWGKKFRRIVQERIERNLLLLDDSAKKLRTVNVLTVEGGWYAILRLPHIQTDEAWALALLKKEGVLAYPGHFFDLGEEAVLVVSLLVPEPLFEKGVKKIARLVSGALISSPS